MALEGPTQHTTDRAVESGAGDALPEAALTNGSTPSPYRRLHPGPGATREQVAFDQRARICQAMIELVSEGGFGAVTVRALVRRAGVSTHTFYEHFHGKEECFLWVYEQLIQRSAERVRAAQRGSEDWRERLGLAFAAFAGGIAHEPKEARLALVEAFAGGPAALERMGHAEGVFEAMIEQSFALAPDGIAAPPLVVKGIVAGVHRVARAWLLAGRAHELAGLTDELVEWILCFRCREAGALARLGEQVARMGPAMEPAIATDGNGDGDAIVRRDDRARILDATAWLAGREGYWQLRVPQIRLAAGVSRKRFDEHFAGVPECFMAALEHQTARVLAAVAPAGATGRTWPGGLHRALYAFCCYVAADPVFARIGFIEVFALGPHGVICRERLMAGGAEAFRASAPEDRRPSELAAEASVGACWGIMHRYVATGRSEQLPRIAPVLSFMALAPAIGAHQAVAEIAAEQERMGEDADRCRALAASAG